MVDDSELSSGRLVESEPSSGRLVESELSNGRLVEVIFPSSVFVRIQ